MNDENKLIRGWKLKLGMVMAIMIPTISATGTFYSLKLDSQSREAKMNERVSSLEISSGKQYADKTDLKDIRDDIKELRNQVSEIKSLLIRQSRD